MTDDGPKWTLKIPFTVASPMPLTEGLSEVIDGRVVAIEAGKTIDHFVISGLADADDACRQFEVMKGGVLAASLQIGGGCAFVTT